MEKDISSKTGLRCALEALSETEGNSVPVETGGIELRAIIGKTRGRTITDFNGKIIDATNDRIDDDDRYEIEGILQDYSIGWVTFSSAYRTDSRDTSSPLKTEKGKNLYIETRAREEGTRFYDPQGFCRELSERGYS